MHPSPTTPVSYFNFYVIYCYFQLEIKFWLVFQGCLIHIYLRYVPHFDSLIHSNIFLRYFLLVFCIGWQLFLLFILVLPWWTVGLMICICVLVFYRDFGHSKMFLILSVEPNLELGLKLSFSIHISLSFCFLRLDLVNCRTFPSFIHNECQPIPARCNYVRRTNFR